MATVSIKKDYVLKGNKEIKKKFKESKPYKKQSGVNIVIEKKTISLHDHELLFMADFNEGKDVFVDCTCGKQFEYIDDFNKHQKEELNKQLKDQDINVEVV